MKAFYSIILILSLSQPILAQLANGSPAPDFQVNTITGGSFSLSGALAGGKSACIDVMATWCGPCWSFHNSHILRDVYNNLAAHTTVIMIEADLNTNTSCLYGPSGCVGGTQGNWVTGTPYPIADLSSTNGTGFNQDYNINYFPTLYVISPDMRTWEIKSRSYGEYENWITKSFKLNATGAVTHSNCGDDGRVLLNVTLGYGILNYKWSNNAITKDLTGIGSGTYTVTITDQNGYFKEFGPWTINGVAKKVAFTSQSLKHIKCFGDQTGSIILDVDFGTPPYSYNWSNGSTDLSLYNLEAGQFKLTVTDNNNCTLTKSFTINQPPDLTASALTNEEYCDFKDGRILVFANGGVGPYKYDLGRGVQLNSIFTNLSAGYYHVTITDNNLCKEEIDVDVLGTHKPKAEAGLKLALNCNYDTLEITGEGSSVGPHLDYYWTTKTGRIISSARELKIEVDKPGRYVLKVIDRITDCENFDSVDIDDVRKFPNVEAIGDNLINCKITELLLSGKTISKPIKYFWTSNDTSFRDTSSTITTKVGGAFIFHVLDTTNLCESRDTVIIKMDTDKPKTFISEQPDLNCTVKEGIIDASKSEQGSHIVFNWTTVDGRFIEGQQTLTPKVDKDGVYVLRMENINNGCVTLQDVIISKDIELPTVHTGPRKDILKCTSDESTLDGSLSSQGNYYTYLWTTLTGNIISGVNTLYPIVNKAGTYHLKIVNTSNTCVNESGIEIFEQETPDALYSFQKTDLTINLEDLSKGLPLIWKWNLGDGSSSPERNPTHTYANYGTYEICLEVSNDCGSKSICKNIVLENSSVLSLASWEIHPVSCFGVNDGSIKLFVTGGLAPYSYHWDHGENSANVFNLSKGSYSVTITDNLGAVIIKSFNINQPTEILAKNIQITGSAIQNPSGRIELKVEGGIPPYRFHWSNGATTENIADLPIGVYNLTVKDANDCEKVFGPIEVKEVTGTVTLDNLILFTISPNPVNKHATLEIKFDELRTYNLQIINILGTEYKNFNGTAMIAHYNIQADEFNAGVYYAILRSGKGIQTIRFVIP
ncbi:MAG: PKD domain-containing protein [Bacteroidota bacterium]|nr:PKD domain-containing protein [Bacteroidota bacterium]